MKYTVSGLVCLIAAAMIFISCTESTQRGLKNFTSNYMGGLDRICTVYSMSGKEIKTYEGTFDLQPSDRQLLFDLNGKRHIIRNATVICDEK